MLDRTVTMSLPLSLVLAQVAMAAVPAAHARESFEVVMPQAPVPVRTEGRDALSYELHLTNFAAAPLVVRGVTVLDGARPIAQFSGVALADRLALVGGPSRTEAAIAPGARAILYVDIAVAPGEAPKRLAHRVTYAVAGQEAVSTLDTAPVATGTTSPVVLGAPLRAGTWVAVHATSWPRGHRRVTYAVGGRATIPGRYAIDFVGLDPAGRTTSGDPDRPADAIGYGAPVLAGADAEVAAARDGMAESASIKDNPGHALGDGAGNYVALALGGGRYAFYEHLHPGSVRVKAGQKVRRGEVIGALGFSGDTTGPHLHLHVADGPDPLAAEGLPYLIDAFTVLGDYPDIGALGRQPWRPEAGPAAKTAEWPGANVVVRFVP
jgi:murein DD-endopeptidase